MKQKTDLDCHTELYFTFIHRSFFCSGVQEVLPFLCLLISACQIILSTCVCVCVCVRAWADLSVYMWEVGEHLRTVE